MSNIQKLQAFRAKNILVLTLSAALLLVGVASLASPRSAYAADALQSYCKKKIDSDKAAKGCTTKNMDRIREAVDNGCSNKKNVQDCIQSEGKKVIDTVASGHPTSETAFNNKLDDAIRDVKNKQHGGRNPCEGSECSPTPTGQGKNCDEDRCDLIALYVNPAIQLLSIVVGLVVAASLVFAGIQYTTSTGDPQRTSQAKSRITNTLLAFFVYVFFLAFLNFLIPGGLF